MPGMVLKRAGAVMPLLGIMADIIIWIYVAYMALFIELHGV